MIMPAIAEPYDERPAGAASAASSLAEPTGSPSVPEGGYASALCVIVPTRNESGNIDPLIERAAQALQGYEAELLFVDDSTDDTPMVILRAAQTAQLGVRLLHREV